MNEVKIGQHQNVTGQKPRFPLGAQFSDEIRSFHEKSSASASDFLLSCLRLTG